MNFFTWIRDGVRSAVLLGVSDAVNDIGTPAQGEDIGRRLLEQVKNTPTALENGVALMHPRRPMPKILAQPFLALGCTTTGIPFGSDCPLTDVFFLILSADDRGHLHTLARLSRLLTLPGFLNELHQAEDAKAAHALVVEAEEKL